MVLKLGTLRAVDQKHLESFEMCCWRRMENISWTDRVRSEEVLHSVKERRNILHEIRKRKAKWIGHILRRNCLLWKNWRKDKRENTSDRKTTKKLELLADLKDKRRYSHLKEEALDRTVWRAGFGRGFGPVVRQTANWMNERILYSLLSYYPTGNFNQSYTVFKTVGRCTRIYNCIPALSTLKMATCVPETGWWTQCNIITSIKPRVFLRLVIYFTHLITDRSVAHIELYIILLHELFWGPG
jgi:hypothetical protein